MTYVSSGWPDYHAQRDICHPRGDKKIIERALSLSVRE